MSDKIRKYKDKKCVICGEMFTPTNSKNKYCGKTCWNKKRRDDRNEEKEPPPNFEERFWNKVDVKTNDECWEWKASLTIHGGYGQLNDRGKLLKAHRVAYEIAKGKIPESLFICHKCNNPKCCNPNHLYAGTPADNWNDTIKSGHAHKLPPIKSEEVHCVKLNYEIVQEIRKSKGKGVDLAEKYGVTPTTISCIRRNKTWKNQTIQ